MLRELIRNNRSYRRFHEDIPVSLDTLRGLVDLARLSASAANAQPLKYALICDPVTNTQVFENLAWAAYLKEWDGPSAGERPSAYIIILGDRTIRQVFGIDPGIAAQSILLGATELGLGGCILASIKKDALRTTLQIPEQLEILFVIALGKPREQIVLEDVGPNGNIEYWRDEAGGHHVPKRSLDDVIVNLPEN